MRLHSHPSGFDAGRTRVWRRDIISRVQAATARFRWLVRGNAVAMNFFATGMAWTYVVVRVAQILDDLAL